MEGRESKSNALGNIAENACREQGERAAKGHLPASPVAEFGVAGRGGGGVGWRHGRRTHVSRSDFRGACRAVGVHRAGDVPAGDGGVDFVPQGEFLHGQPVADPGDVQPGTLAHGAGSADRAGRRLDGAVGVAGAAVVLELDQGVGDGGGVDPPAVVDVRVRVRPDAVRLPGETAGGDADFADVPAGAGADRRVLDPGGRGPVGAGAGAGYASGADPRLPGRGGDAHLDDQGLLRFPAGGAGGIGVDRRRERVADVLDDHAADVAADLRHRVHPGVHRDDRGIPDGERGAAADGAVDAGGGREQFFVRAELPLGGLRGDGGAFGAADHGAVPRVPEAAGQRADRGRREGIARFSNSFPRGGASSPSEPFLLENSDCPDSLRCRSGLDFFVRGRRRPFPPRTRGSASLPMRSPRGRTRFCASAKEKGMAQWTAPTPFLNPLWHRERHGPGKGKTRNPGVPGFRVSGFRPPGAARQKRSAKARAMIWLPSALGWRPSSR